MEERDHLLQLGFLYHHVSSTSETESLQLTRFTSNWLCAGKL